MDKFIISGGKRLSGEVRISGNKNASLAVLAGVCLCDKPCRIENLAQITDIDVMVQIYSYLGADIRYLDKGCLEIDPSGISNLEIPYSLTRLMRASYYFMGGLLGRFGYSKVCMPGGCDIGTRAIDQHIKGFEALNARVCETDEYVECEAEGGRTAGGHVYFDCSTVGGTINVILAAVKADGVTIIENAAKEPHIVDMANFLNSCGADIRGAGTDLIKVYGVDHLEGGTYSVIPDQIEAGTFMAVAAATGGDVMIQNVIPKHLESISAKLTEMGVEILEGDDWLRVRGNLPLQHVNVKTLPHPGFPTDMQAQIGVLCSIADGTSVINETIYDNRFRYIEELIRMGAHVTVNGRTASFEGVDHLTGTSIRAYDLRAGIAMVIAGLVAEGVTEVENVRFIDRGYEFLEQKLASLGADIQRVSQPDADARSV